MTRLETGAHVGAYRVEALVGEGSVGAVYVAYDEALERRVALKVLAPELSRDERFRERFIRESRIAASLEHPAIVPIYAAGELDGGAYLAMRLVDGGDLGALIEQEGRLEPDRALAILGQIADALDAAHERDLVHRDVKPGNILVGPGERAYLCDFGLAKHAATVSSLSRDSAFAGTIDYIAPEQIQGGEVDARADEYSLACVLFQCLTGAAPFHRDTELAVVLAHLNQAPPSLSALRPELSPELDEVVRRGLAKAPAERYDRCSDLIADAQAAVAGGSTAAGRSGAATVRTFLIADVRGYTRYTQQHGDEAGAALAGAFAELVSTVVRKQSGRLIELRGDEALVVFDSARKALQAAVEIQRRVVVDELPRGVGIGLDAGEAVPVGEGYRGGALNMAARLCALAAPGEVLSTEGVVHLARRVDGIRYLEGRLERLKGIDEPVRVVEVVPEQRADALLGRIRRRVRGRRWVPAVVAGVALALVAAVAAVLTLTGGAAATAAVNSVGIFDAASHRFVESIDVGGEPGDVFSAEGAIWTNLQDGTLVKIDPRTRRVVRKFAAGPVQGWTIADGSIWWPSQDRPELQRIDPTYFTVDRISLPEDGFDEGEPTTARSVAVGAGSVWLARGWDRLDRVDPTSGRVLHTFAVPGAQWVRFAHGSVYATGSLYGTVWKIDPRTNRVVWRTRLQPWINDLAVTGGYVWAVVGNEGTVYKLRESDGSQVGSIAVGGDPQTGVPGTGALWVDSPRSGEVTRIDVVSDSATTFSSVHAAAGIAPHGGQVWVGLFASPEDELANVDGKVARFAIRSDNFNGQTDPAVAWGGRQWELEYATQAKLFNYPDKPAPAGGTLVPEVAAAMPRVSSDGRTYTIRIRPGFRFSPPSNAPVTAETFRFSIERALSPQLADVQPGSFYLGDVAGLSAFQAGRTQHLAGLRAKGDTLTIRLTKPIPDLPSRLALPFFSAVPENTPLKAIDEPLPSAGPYYLASHGWYVVLKRNPNYEGDRPNALDAVVYELDVGTGAAAERIERGEIDYVTESFPDPGVLTPSGELARRYRVARPGRPQWLALSRPGIRFFRLNTSRGLFRDVRLRQAVNYAIDRRALAAVNGEPVSDQYLPPTMPGVGRRHVYPVAGPDVRRARAVARSRGRRAVLFTCTRPDCTARARILKQNLAPIGITVVVRTFDEPFDQTAGFDIRDDQWYVDEYDPRDILVQVLFGEDPHVNPDRFDDARWRPRMEAAERLAGQARLDAFAAAAAGVLRTSAPWAAFSQPIDPALVSARLGCRILPAAYGGLDIAALCLREDNSD